MPTCPRTSCDGPFGFFVPGQAPHRLQLSDFKIMTGRQREFGRRREAGRDRGTGTKEGRSWPVRRPVQCFKESSVHLHPCGSQCVSDAHTSRIVQQNGDVPRAAPAPPTPCDANALIPVTKSPYHCARPMADLTNLDSPPPNDSHTSSSPSLLAPCAIFFPIS